MEDLWASEVDSPDQTSQLLLNLPHRLPTKNDPISWIFKKFKIDKYDGPPLKIEVR